MAKSPPFWQVTVGHWAPALAWALIPMALAACKPAPSPTAAATAVPFPTSLPSPAITATARPSILPPAHTPTPSVKAVPTATPFLLPPVGQGDWSRGPEQAAVTLVVYSDFQ
jgi:hypothetical protein